jgi:hypothetical protein
MSKTGAVFILYFIDGFMKNTTFRTAHNQCKEAFKNCKVLAGWIAENRWIDQCELAAIYPAILVIQFTKSSQAMVMKRLGGDGWYGGFKRVDGVMVGIQREEELN